jgi:hypothetical protein
MDRRDQLIEKLLKKIAELERIIEDYWHGAADLIHLHLEIGYELSISSCRNTC